MSKLCPTLVTPWTSARQDPLSMGFSRNEYWGGLPFPSPGNLPGPGTEPRSPALPADSSPTELQGERSNVSYLVLVRMPCVLQAFPCEIRCVSGLMMSLSCVNVSLFSPLFSHRPTSRENILKTGSPKYLNC